MTLFPIDWIVIAIYGFVLAILGFVLTRQSRTAEGYFLWPDGVWAGRLSARRFLRRISRRSISSVWPGRVMRTAWALADSSGRRFSASFRSL